MGRKLSAIFGGRASGGRASGGRAGGGRDEHARMRVLFICHGNICRSAMAQCVLQHMVDKRGVAGCFTIDSAATTNDQIGSPIHPPARLKLEQEGVPIVPHRARRIQAGEDAGWDHIVCMDDENIRHLRRILGPENCWKVRKLLSFVGETGNVADPWYTGDFDATYFDVVRGCGALLDEVLRSSEASGE